MWWLSLSDAVEMRWSGSRAGQSWARLTLSRVWWAPRQRAIFSAGAGHESWPWEGQSYQGTAEPRLWWMCKERWGHSLGPPPGAGHCSSGIWISSSAWWWLEWNYHLSVPAPPTTGALSARERKEIRRRSWRVMLCCQETRCSHPRNLQRK